MDCSASTRTKNLIVATVKENMHCDVMRNTFAAKAYAYLFKSSFGLAAGYSTNRFEVL